uniref:CRAL-TRIO domain-containing protein n=1 Tax=Heterorhabditis bacteriophora TaxID=37862 RepID=A0A1I7W6Z2_HETBA
MSSYMVPTSSINNLMQVRVNIWLDYYAELLKHVIIVNPPTFLTLAWKVMSFLLPAKVHNRFHFASKYPDQLIPYLSLSAIPPAFSGSKTVVSELNNGCFKSAKITDDDFAIDGLLWKKEGLECVVKTHSIKASENSVLEFPTKGKTRLIYQYTTNGEAQIWFEQVKISLAVDFF